MTGEVFYSAEEAAGHFGPCAVAIGNFDGVHIGHEALIGAAARHAAENNLAAAALTFHPHPAVVLGRRQPEMICTLEERVRLLHEAGAQKVMVLPFTRELSQRSPRQFVEEIVRHVLNARAVFTGDNFRFGRAQAGNASMLADLGNELGFSAHPIAPVTWRGEVVSSTRIRNELRANSVFRAARLLGRWWSLHGPVVSGKGIGRRETVPTLNQLPVPGLVLPRGIFVTETLDKVGGRRWRSVTSVGTRPTFDDGDVTVETYLLDELTGETPAVIEVRFHRFLREERKYDSAAELKAQIWRDVERAQAWWRRLDALRSTPAYEGRLPA